MQRYRLGEGPYGSAYQGTIADLFEAGDLQPIQIQDRSFGLFLGHFDWQRSILHSWREPVKGFRAWRKKLWLTRNHTEIIRQVQELRFTGDQHQLIVASSGSGKFRDVLSNMLLYDGSCETACLIIDPKGEIASTIGPMIDAPGELNARTVILDPWDVTGTGATDSLTLLDGIRLDNPHCVKDARVLADAIIIERGAEDGHWAATAKSFLAALLLYLGLDPLEKDERTLFRLRQIVTTPWDGLTDLLGYMSDSPLFEGLIARAARAMLNRDEKERRAILSTLERDTAFVEDPGLWKCVKTSSFDMNELVMSNKRLHVIVPFDYTDQMSSWLRLTIAAFYNACLRNQLPKQWPTYLQFRHIIMDEFAGLGKLDFITKGIAEARGAGIKYHLVVQNFAQLNSLYRESWENLVSNSFIRAFGITDHFTSDYLSKMTGQSTVITQSTSVSRTDTTGSSNSRGSTYNSGKDGGSSGTSSGTTDNFSTATGTSTTISSTGRAVLMPDEIRRISSNQQLLFLRQMPVVLARRTPYFQLFKQYLPDYTLRDVLSTRRLPSGSRALAPMSSGALSIHGRLMPSDRISPEPSFVTPSYRHYTFWQALRQSPDVVVKGILSILVVGSVVGYLLSLIVADEAKELRRQAGRRKMDAFAAQQASSYDNVATAIAAHVVPYFQVVCNEPNFQCPTKPAYKAGSSTPVQFELNVGRKVISSFSLSEQSEKRGDKFNGALARVTIKSAFDTANLNDLSQIPNPFGQTVLIILGYFAVTIPDSQACMAGGVSTISNGTTVSCRFIPRPAGDNFAEFEMILSRQM